MITGATSTQFHFSVDRIHDFLLLKSPFAAAKTRKKGYLIYLDCFPRIHGLSSKLTIILLRKFSLRLKTQTIKYACVYIIHVYIIHVYNNNNIIYIYIYIIYIYNIYIITSFLNISVTYFPHPCHKKSRASILGQDPGDLRHLLSTTCQMYHLRGSAEDAADRHTQGAQGHHLSERFFSWGNGEIKKGLPQVSFKGCNY